MNEYVAEANLANPDKVKSFKASHNWLTRYCRRMNLPNKKGPIPGTTSRLSNRKAQSSESDAVGRKKRVLPLNIHDSETLSITNPIADELEPIAQIAHRSSLPVIIKTSSNFMQLNQPSDDSSDDEESEMQHIMIQQAVPPSTSISTPQSNANSSLVEEIEEVIMDRSGETSASTSSTNKKGKLKRVLVGGAV
eukprot:gene29572-36643_t